mgnify:CR=1 FL=1
MVLKVADQVVHLKAKDPQMMLVVQKMGEPK